jgi:hypothetical protein
MKKYTKAMMVLCLFLTGFAAEALAQRTMDVEPITVTFRVNTSTVSDTLNGGVIQIRGNVNGNEYTDYFGQVIDWSANSIQGQHIAGDYWEIPILLAPGDVLTHKFWVGHDIDNGAVNYRPDQPTNPEIGWETGGNKVFTVPSDATEDIVTEVIYFNRTQPFDDADEGFAAVHFRVNVGAQVATNEFDPENEDHVVGVRGTFDAATGNFLYKFVIDTPGGTAWEGGVGTGPDGNRVGSVVEADTTLRWKFFNNQRPPSGELVEATIEFRANVSLLESLGFFSRSIGDAVAVPGTFNNWDTETSMAYDELLDAWVSTFELTREVGSIIPYKYYIQWDPSRFDETSENYIPNLTAGNGWEEPGATGGGNRLFEFGADEFQIVTGDFGTDTGFFNSLPIQALITSSGVGADNMLVTFELDMEPALTAEIPFDPEESEVFLVLDTPVFAITQGLRTGTAALDIPEQREKLTFSRVDDTMMYELVMTLELPTENHFGFQIAYLDDEDNYITNGGGFDAGRRYYRYVEPLFVIGEDVEWPQEFTLDTITWKQEDLDFPAPPDYGLGGDDRPVIFQQNGNDLDWGVTFPLTREGQVENNNHFYSGTLYFPKQSVNIENPGTETPREIALGQNYPNPFNPTTNINFLLPEAMNVRLDVYNILGQRVATLANGAYTAGTHTVQFDASRLSSGVYLYRLQAGSFSAQRTMMLVK